MELTGLHLLLTYQCTHECDHCFVWGSPSQSGTMTLEGIRRILAQAAEAGSVEWIYFEGGEPFLYYAVLLRGVQEAADMGFKVGIVSNAYWATDRADADECLRPLAGRLQDLSVSSDLFHWSQPLSRQAQMVQDSAGALGIPIGVISIAQPQGAGDALTVGQLPAGEGGVMYRGRAAQKLAHLGARRPWEQLTECPHEDLREPGRVHVDPFGNLHVCQGISAGNLFSTPLKQICSEYDPDSHPVIGPLLAGGPAELARRHGIAPEAGYADACHLCYEVRRSLRGRFPDSLLPDQMYGVPAG
jgi:hypothetical protein